MVRIFTHTEEIEHCGECPNCDLCGRGVDDICIETDKLIRNIWGEMPSWCPLPDKKKSNDRV